MFRECYRTATVRESVPLPIFSQLLRESVLCADFAERFSSDTAFAG
jgi:hypothetical protein